MLGESYTNPNKTHKLNPQNREDCRTGSEIQNSIMSIKPRFIINDNT